MKIIRQQIVLFILLSLQYSCLFAHEKITVLLDWFINPSHAPLFVANEMGFFKEQGLEVTLIGPADPADPPKLVASGKADIAITYEPELMQQVDHGLPLVRIGTLITTPLDCLVTLKSSQIHNPAHLINKRIGYSSGGTQGAIIKAMLAHEHVPLHSVELINLHYGLSQALLSKKVDAITGVMRTFEVIQLELMHHPVTVFYPEHYGVPTYSELVLVIQPKNQHDPRFIKFLRALKKGTAYLKTHPDTMWVAFKNKHPELDNELNHRAWKATLSYFADDPMSFNAAQWITFADFLQKNQIIQAVQPIDHYAITLAQE
jgi:putative hydroxymethylpyrimidine transport system substrate-binding protein